MLIAIQSYGLGGVWLGVYPDENRVANLRTLFEIDESTVLPFALVPIGFAKNPRFQTTERYDASRIFRNTMKHQWSF
jgi:nitroreductase